ncbi:hypothetical protein WA577_007048 [Blastocystis sp. JDR]
MKTLSLTLLLLAIASAANWVVLVCGSEGYGNYRHHADISHAYQIVKAGGVDPDHIITLMYNDVPFSEENPFPGQLYNHPGDDVPDVYKGVVVDYEKKEVSPENLIKVLTGDDSTGKKVLKSTEEDNVFLFFSDHGGPDILALPGGYLYSKDLLGAIKTMHEKKMYKKFVLYIEACYSGSMFLKLPDNLNVVAVTAANDQESSWGWYCGDEAVVKGKDLYTCLGDEFSVYWMEDADKGEQKTETLDEQFKRLVKGVTKSHVMRYGDVSFKDDVIGEFIGYPKSGNAVPYQHSFVQWDSRDNEMLYRLYKAQHTTGKEQKKWQKLYEEEVASRKAIDRYFNALAKEAKYYQMPEPVENTECYARAIKQFEDIMGKSDYSLKYFNVFANMCNENPLAFSEY